jgi:FkbH-like protein
VDIIVLLPWHQRLLAAGKRTHAQRIEDELGTLQQAWSMIPSNARLVQVGYDWVNAGSMGFQLGSRFDGDVRLVRRMNETLIEALPSDCYFVDLEQVSADFGHRDFYDQRNYAWTKQPFSSDGVYELSRHLFSAVRAVTTGPKKVLILDLDNTVWGGVVGELGPLGVELGESPDGEAFRSFQTYTKQLKDRGILLAVCSKNNPADAHEPFESNRDMVLSLKDIAAFEASWDPKPVAIQRIAKTLNLGLDSFVFFDDNPAEREAVRQQLPTVDVVDAPQDPADYISALQNGLWFESLSVTTADRERADQYCAEQHRRAVQESTSSLPDYLTSLEMRAEVNEVDGADMKRVVQLISKTNQFNLTTRRHTAGDIQQMTQSEDAVGLTLRLSDRFGDYGLVSVVIGMPIANSKTPTLQLDTWLMSCRAIGRTVELYFMNAVVQHALALGYKRIVGEYIPTAKNPQVAEFYPNAGFKVASTSEDGSRKFELNVSHFQACTTYVLPNA